MKFLKLIAGRVAFWAGWPLWWLLLRKSIRTRVLLMHGNEAMLVRGTLSSGRWTLPGGGVQGGEIPAEAALREIKEELKLELSPKKLVPLGEMRAKGDNGLHFDCLLFAYELDTKTPMRASLEIVEARWFKLDEIPVLPTQQLVRTALELFMTK